MNYCVQHVLLQTLVAASLQGQPDPGQMGEGRGAVNSPHGPSLFQSPLALAPQAETDWYKFPVLHLGF